MPAGSRSSRVAFLLTGIEVSRKILHEYFAVNAFASPRPAWASPLSIRLRRLSRQGCAPAEIVKQRENKADTMPSKKHGNIPCNGLAILQILIK